MRIRAVVAIVLLLLPMELSAQRIPLPRIGRRPPRTTPLPPQPPEIARELAYKRMHLSVETYPLISYVRSPGFISDGAVATWTSFGMGTRADYRVTRHVSATLDLTSSFLGGPVFTETAELGTRLRPERSERRAYPFADVRVGYMMAFHSYGGPFQNEFPVPQQFASGARYSQGVGAIGGVGMEYALTRRFSLTTAGSVMRNRMTAYGFQDTRPTNDRYSMTTYRFIVGLRFNPVRLIRPPGTP